MSESEPSTTYGPRNARLVRERVSGDPAEDSFLPPELDRAKPTSSGRCCTGVASASHSSVLHRVFQLLSNCGTGSLEHHWGSGHQAIMHDVVSIPCRHDVSVPVLAGGMLVLRLFQSKKKSR